MSVQRTRGEHGEVVTGVVVLTFLLAGAVWGLFAGWHGGGVKVADCIDRVTEAAPNVKLHTIAPQLKQECKP